MAARVFPSRAPPEVHIELFAIDSCLGRARILGLQVHRIQSRSALQIRCFGAQKPPSSGHSTGLSDLRRVLIFLESTQDE